MKIIALPVSFCFSTKGSSQAGFSLLELAIVLVILGIIAGFSLPLLTAQINRNAHIKTRTHQEYVLHALAAYVEKNGRFPCPAAPQATGVSLGLSKVHCRMKEAVGLLPFKTLGISEVYAKDGFKRYMTYVVEPELTKPDTALLHEQGGWITVKKEDMTSVLPPSQKNDPNPNYVALVLISHGESGLGSYAGKGTTVRLTGPMLSSHKKENMDDNFTFMESGQTDDLIVWESRDQFLRHYVTSKDIF